MNRMSYALTVRFPFGTEFWQTENLPEIGDTISRHGSDYLVVSCDELPDNAFALRVVEQETKDGGEPALA